MYIAHSSELCEHRAWPFGAEKDPKEPVKHASLERSSAAYDSWGTVTRDNYWQKVVRTAHFKAHLLAMADAVLVQVKLFEQVHGPVNLFLTDGSLLGACRNGQMIPSDYDFDYGVLLHRDQLRALNGWLKKCLDCKYTVRLVDRDANPERDYAFKIMVYEESHGMHRTDEPDWYNVILDIQQYELHDDGTITISYYRGGHDQRVKWNVSTCLPLRKIMFEGREYPCLKDPETFLRESYGYLGTDAVFDKATGKYIKGR